MVNVIRKDPKYEKPDENTTWTTEATAPSRFYYVMVRAEGIMQSTQKNLVFDSQNSTGM